MPFQMALMREDALYLRSCSSMRLRSSSFLPLTLRPRSLQMAFIADTVFFEEEVIFLLRMTF